MHIEHFQVLADPTRLRIVEMLRGGEQSVNEIVESVYIDQSGVSRHLGILHEAGFVRVRPEGQRRFYSLCPEPFKDLAAWVSRYQRLWEGRLDKFGEALVRGREAKKIALQTRESPRRQHHERKSESPA
jgi:DNA-binding transcriptional ArsR family regulator